MGSKDDEEVLEEDGGVDELQDIWSDVAGEDYVETEEQYADDIDKRTIEDMEDDLEPQEEDDAGYEGLF